MDWYPIQGVFQDCTQGSWDSLWIQSDPDPENELDGIWARHRFQTMIIIVAIVACWYG